MSFRVQIALLVGLSVVVVATALLFLEQRAMRAHIIADVVGEVSEAAGDLEDQTIEAAAEGGPRAGLTTLRREIVEQAEETRFVELEVTDASGVVVAGTEGDVPGSADPEWDVKKRVLSTGEPLVVPDVDGRQDVLDIVVPFELPGGGRGTLEGESDLPHLREQIDRARTEGLVPGLLTLALAVPIAVFTATRFAESSRARERAAEARFRSLVDNSSDVILIADRTGTVEWNTASISRVLGHAAADLRDRPLAGYVADEDLPALDRLLSVTGDPETGARAAEITFRHADGSWRELEIIASDLTDEAGVGGVVLTMRDVSERKRAEEVLRASEERFRSLVQNSADVIVVLDRNGAVRYVSPSVERVLGYAPEEELGRNVFDRLHPDDTPDVRQKLVEILAQDGAVATAEVRARHADGTWRWLEVSGMNLLGDPAVRGVVVNYRDVTERKELEEQLTRQTFMDPLTNLPNRALFKNRLGHAVSRIERDALLVAVVLLDLDDFKSINDSLGHDVGDEVLVAVGRRLRGCLRPADTTARLSGDEFVLLLEDLGSGEEAVAVVARVMEALTLPLVVGEHRISVRASMGIVTATSAAEEPDALLRNADVAMYKAKSGGRGRYEIYEPRMRAALLERLGLERDLQRAIENDEFTLHYQPIVSLDDRRIVGSEALLRWEHPERGMVSPASFIPLAEDTGLILPIGRWVISTACRQARQWQREHSSLAGLSISVNLSARQFEQADLAQEVAAALHAAELDPGSLTVEITESLSMQDTEATIARLNELKSLGLLIAIDDFGTGYSSLAYLQRFPIDSLKIDKAFVDGVARGAEERALADSMVRLADSLGLGTVAEGIEDEEQVRALIALGCDYGQGFHFSKPVEAHVFGRLLESGLLSAHAVAG
jgi:diguanylate cyclase (GGDEF)-like protein/PAS domain S-box-containing protein